jgi:hypothetical protein
MEQAYVSESERWCYRASMDKSCYEIVRNDSPKNDIVSDELMTVRQLPRNFDHEDANEIFEMDRGRAAMYAALIAGDFL